MFKKFWKWLLAILSVIGLFFVWTEIKRKRAIKAGAKKKLDKLVETNLDYHTRIKNVQKAQNKLDKNLITEQTKYAVLENEKKKLRSKMSIAAVEKGKQYKKVDTLNQALVILEAKYGK